MAVLALVYYFGCVLYACALKVGDQIFIQGSISCVLAVRCPGLQVYYDCAFALTLVCACFFYMTNW